MIEIDKYSNRDILSLIRSSTWRHWVIASTVGWALGPVLAGLTRSFVLRQHINKAGWWSVVTIIGFLAGRFVAPGGSFSLVGAFVTGAVIGVMQWFVLSWSFNLKSGWWILASAVGFSIGRTSGFFVFIQASKLLGPLGYVMSGAANGLVTGAITGFVLVWLLHQYQYQEE